jgi:acetyl-CoA carboxylase beta subunit
MRTPNWIVLVLGYVLELWIRCPKCGAATYSRGGMTEVETCTECDWEEKLV